MGEASLSIRNELPQSRRNPQQVAWGVLLICFAIFCLTCTATGVGIYYFLFLSETPLDVMVRVGRGSIGVNRQFEEVERALSSGSEVSIASPSQATIFVRDPQQGQRLMAVMTVSGGSNLSLLNALRPRFDWSANLFQIEIGEFTGDLNIWIVHDLERELRLIIQTPQHNRIDLGESGQYMVSVREGQTRVVNQDGKAVLIPPDGNNGRDIPAGSQGVIEAASPTEVTLAPAYINLLENSTFQDTMIQESNDTGGLQLITKVWGCASRQDSLPRGLWKTEEVDGRVVLRLIRSDNATSHGETRCLAFLGQNGRDVSDYDYLEMRASFDISYQSLSGCGWDGSECPLMLQMDYIDQNNELQTWRHGFYYVQPQADYPASCNTCRQEHDRVNEKAWYTYTSGNLKALLGPKQIPRTILNVQFYASGHQYDVAIGEVSLLAGQLVGEQSVSGTPSG